MPAEEKIKYADEVIYNDGSLAQLESKVTRHWRKYSRNKTFVYPKYSIITSIACALLIVPPK